MDVTAVYSKDVRAAEPQAGAEQIAQRRQLIEASKAINTSQILGAENELVFVMDRASHRAIMRVVDRQTQEVIMQLPPEYVLNMAAELAGKA